MVTRLKGFLLHKVTILAIISLILGAVLLSLVSPQTFSLSPWEIEKWPEIYSDWSSWMTFLGFGHIFTSPIFLFVLGLFLLSLLLSTTRQFKISFAKTFHGFGASSLPQGHLVISLEGIHKICQKNGYIKTAESNDAFLFVKHPWGFWGNAILHCSIILIVFASLFILLFQQRGVLRLVEGETFSPQNSWFVEEHGSLSSVLRLPYALRLDRLVPEYWPNDDLKDLTSVVSTKYPHQPIVQSTLTITQSWYSGGIRLFQSTNYGLACFLTIKGENGYQERIAMMFKNALKRNKPQFEEIEIDKNGLLQAKYFPDAEQKSMLSRSPLMILRLHDTRQNSTVEQKLELQPGQTGHLGSYTIRFNNAARWVGFIFIRLYAMPFIFLGFILLAVGAGLIFFCPPRKLVVKKLGHGFSFTWSASKFAKFYEDEHKMLISNLLSAENRCT